MVSDLTLGQTSSPEIASSPTATYIAAEFPHSLGRPLKFFMIAGQVSDYTGAAALLGSLPAAEWLIADPGYDADWLREALKDKGIRPCIPGRKSRG
jgi:hypothetical protein